MNLDQIIDTAAKCCADSSRITKEFRFHDQNQIDLISKSINSESVTTVPKEGLISSIYGINTVIDNGLYNIPSNQFWAVDSDGLVTHKFVLTNNIED